LTALAAGLTGIALAATTALAAPAAPAGATAAGAPAGGTVQALLLPTGDQVTVMTGPDGRRTATTRTAATTGVGSVLLNLNVGGRAYELPAAALPYLGRGLDLSLFDVAALAKAETGAQHGRVPLRISRPASATAAPALPGVTTTGDQAGYLTASSAVDFGKALVKQYLADKARGAFGGRGLFAGGSGLALAGATAPKTVTPQYVMHTLTVTGTAADGSPDQGDPVFVYNVDDSGVFGTDPTEALNWFAGGTAKYSVPAGHYAALAIYLTTDADGNVTALREVVKPEFAVTADTTVAAPASDASSQVTMVTPRPALPNEGGFVLERAAAAGAPFYLDAGVGPGVPIRVSPTAKTVTTGTLDSYPYRRLTSPPSVGTPYEYQLQYHASGTIPQQRYQVKAADLATVDAYYYSEYSTVGIRQLAGVFPFESDELVGRGSHQLNLPTHQTEYVSGDPTVLWFGGMAKYFQDLGGGFDAWYGGQYSSGTHVTAGEVTREDWNRFPLHPAGQVSLLPADDTGWPTTPGVVRDGDTESVYLTAFSDNQPGHTGMGVYGEARDTTAGTYELDQDGTVVAAGDIEDTYIPDATFGPRPSTARLVLDATRQGPVYRLSTHSHTEWTWHTAHEDGVTLPAAYLCPDSEKGQPADHDCAVEPLLSLGYAVGNLSLSGTAPVGPQTLDLSVGHLQQSTGGAVTGATVQYSTDDGTTWQDAAITGTGDGHYRATYQLTADPWPGILGYVSLRVTATDAAGGTVSETTTRAYSLVYQ
jgi:hypothetical protein